jgi:hypothetical protein
LALVLGALSTAFAQSSELDQPTPITTNEVAGRIAPRDLGDARQTSHYFTFNGTQGDLLLTIESDNLDGVVDLFLTPGLRPLTQVTLFAGSALNVSKTVFLRKDETLILRVQARTPNDADGTYRVRLGGSFQPAINAAAASSEPETTAANKPSARTPGRGGHRVNAVGARIDEPEVEAPKPEAAEAPKETPTPARDTAATPRAPTPKTDPPRRTRTPTRTETARRPAPKPARKPGAAKTETGAEPTPDETETARTDTAEPTPAKPEPARTRTGRTPRTGRTKAATKRASESTKETAPAAAAPAEAVQSEPTPVPQLGATHLVIENKDGTKVEHDMSTVKSVTVVSQLLVVVLKSGRIERYPMTKLLRMAIEP